MQHYSSSQEHCIPRKLCIMPVISAGAHTSDYAPDGLCPDKGLGEGKKGHDDGGAVYEQADVHDELYNDAGHARVGHKALCIKALHVNRGGHGRHKWYLVMKGMSGFLARSGQVKVAWVGTGALSRPEVRAGNPCHMAAVKGWESISYGCSL